MESRLFSDTCVSFAEHLPIGLIVFIETRHATRVPAYEVIRMVFGTRVCYRARSFNGLPTRRGSTQRTVCFVVVVSTIGTAVVDVECLIGEWFLRAIIISNGGGCPGRCAHVTAMAIETIAMIFAFQLSVGGGYCLFFYRQITTTALVEN